MTRSCNRHKWLAGIAGGMIIAAMLLVCQRAWAVSEADAKSRPAALAGSGVSGDGGMGRGEGAKAASREGTVVARGWASDDVRSRQSEPPPSLFSYYKYQGMAELIIAVADDAAGSFAWFYGKQPVTVAPFVFVTEQGDKKLSNFGITLADQMVAAVNNGTTVSWLGGDRKQQMRGSLQEIDGWLRVHISGENTAGEQRSYAANIEMSEAVYRALYAEFRVQP